MTWAIFGVLWIALSDRIVDAIAPTPHIEDVLQTFKGSAFIVISAVVLFALVRRQELRRRRALERSEERYRHLVEMLPGVVYRNEIAPDDPHRTRCAYMSPRLADILGYTPEEWIADPHLRRRVVHPDDRDVVAAHDDGADDRLTATCEFRAIRKDGGHVWIRDESVVVPGDADHPAYWQGVMLDTTAQRMADLGIHELAESLRSVFAAAPVAILVMDTDSIVRQWNPAAERMFGWTANEAIGRPLPVVPLEGWAGHVEIRDRVLSGTDVAGLELKRRRKDGSDIDVELWTAPLRNADGELDGMVTIFEEVTDRRRAEDERRIAVQRQIRLTTRLELLHAIDREVRSATTVEQIGRVTLGRLGSLIDADRMAVGVIDPKTRALSFPAVVDRERADDVASEPSTPDPEGLALLSQDLLRIDDLAEMRSASAYVEQARSLGLRSALSFALIADGQHVGVLIIAWRRPSAFDDEDEEIGREVASLLAIAIRQQQLRDALAERVAEYARIADERQRMLRRIVTTQEAERERVALELHDGLGQLLTSISLFASDLEDELPASSRPRASRVNELVRRAIADSRRLVWSLRPPELERLGLVPALRRLTEETATGSITVDLHEEIGDLRLDPEAEAVVYRVVQEAVNNAMKHADANAVSILMRRRGNVLSTIVEDDGRGFDPVTIPPGRGLGLIGMRERAELVGGVVVIESSPEAGTRVRFEVPLAATAPSPRRRESAASVVATRGLVGG